MEEDGLKRNEKGQFLPGTAPGPGRPKGQTLKEFQAEQFRQMSPEDKAEWLKDVPKSERWRMSEGNPATKLEGDENSPITLVLKDFNGNSLTKGLRTEELPSNLPPSTPEI
jgi:hypothetical protein